MIYSYITGNLGNQMIEYAFARRLMLKRGDGNLVLNFDRAYKNAYDHETDYAIEYFNIIEYEKAECPAHISYIIRVLRFLMDRFRVKNRLEIIANLGWYRYQRGADYDTISRKSVCVCDGNFETTKYLDDVRDVLLEEFKMRKKLSEDLRALCENLNCKEAICCSVRVWPDQVVNENRVQISPQFYLRALDYILEEIGREREIVLYITSNDIEWCKKNIILQNMQIIWDSSDIRVDAKIELMKQCKYFILSNSTFSYMGAYLSENPDKKIFLPKIEGHGLFGNNVPRGMKKENWVLLDKYTGDKIIETGKFKQ